MTKVKVRVEGHYEVQELPEGKDYAWVPAHALIECDCGQVMDVDTHHTSCPGCGTDHTSVAQAVAGRHLSEDVLHPWHREYDKWIEFKQRHRDYDEEWSEIRELE